MKLRKDITTTQLMAVDYKYNYSDKELWEDWKKLKISHSYKNGSQYKPGMKLCQHFMPNFWHIENSKGQSFAKLWQDPKIMDQVRQWGLESMSELWLSWIRRAVFMRGGLANSSFYRPHFSKQVIEMTDIPFGTLFDPCAGWGGRMLGTVAADWDYVSCEPNPETYANLQRMIDFLDCGSRVSLHNVPVENFNIESIKPDVVLTSPPYFNLEVYTNHGDQSYIKHNTFDAWSDNWLKPLIERCLNVINPNGISAWNVMNFGKNDLVEAVMSVHKKMGWRLESTVGFDSPLNNIRKLKNKDVTYVFRKQ